MARPNLCCRLEFHATFSSGFWYGLVLEAKSTDFSGRIPVRTGTYQVHTVLIIQAAEFCPKFVRVHGIKFLENRCLQLKCAGIRGVLRENGKFFKLDVRSVFERSITIAVH